MGIAAQRRVAVVHYQAPDLDAHVVERAAVRLDQRSILRGLPLNEEYDLRFHFLCDGERCVTGRQIVNKFGRS